MSKKTFFHVKKRTLLVIAGCVWLLAGFNVARLGIIAYKALGSIKALHIIISIVVFALFNKRIKGYEEAYKPVWHFFDLKSYIIMAFMMSGGIWLRSSGLVPDVFIAVFYTGLGLALALAGILFWIMFFMFNKHGF